MPSAGKGGHHREEAVQIAVVEDIDVKAAASVHVVSHEVHVIRTYARATEIDDLLVTLLESREPREQYCIGGLLQLTTDLPVAWFQPGKEQVCACLLHVDRVTSKARHKQSKTTNAGAQHVDAVPWLYCHREHPSGCSEDAEKEKRKFEKHA